MHQSKKIVSPIILFGIEHWTKKRPLWNFIKKVSKNRPYGELLFLTEDENEIIDRILAYNPKNYSYSKKEI